MADKFKIKPLYDRCERFIAEKVNLDVHFLNILIFDSF